MKQVLVVDDDDLNLMLASKLLEANDCKVSSYTTAAEGLKAIRHTAFEVLFIDLHMPEMNGLEMIESALAQGDLNMDQTNVFLLTGDASYELKGEIKQALPPKVKILQKPLNSTLLIDIL